MPKKKKDKKDAEEVCEVFEVKKPSKKDSKEKIQKACGLIEKKHATKKDLKEQNKTLRNILIGLAVVIILILGVIYIINSAKTFSYRGITGNVVKEGDILFYQVAFPYPHEGQIVPWSIYIRNDPRKLDKIPFEGEIDFGRRFIKDGHYRLVFNLSDEFDCGGYESIAIGNMANLEALRIKVMSDENATCDPEGRYMYLNIKKGEESKITQIGNNSCYELSVKDCEILEVTERFMVEAFVEYYSE